MCCGEVKKKKGTTLGVLSRSPLSANRGGGGEREKSQA